MPNPITLQELRAQVDAAKAIALRNADANRKIVRSESRAVSTGLVLAMGRSTVPVSSFADASAKFEAVRDASGLGGSKLPDGRILLDGLLVARVSYNGRVWPPEPYSADQRPLYSPSGWYGDPQDAPEYRRTLALEA